TLTAPFDLLQGQAPQFSHVTQILGNAEVVIETEYLSQVAYIGACCARRTTENDRVTARRRHHAAENLEDRTLTCTVRADETKDFARCDREVDAHDSFYWTVVLLETG